MAATPFGEEKRGAIEYENKNGKHEWFFPYPDPVVRTAYKLPLYNTSIDKFRNDVIFNQLLPLLSRYYESAYTTLTTDSKKNMIIFPISSSLRKVPKILFDAIGQYQYLIHSNDKPENEVFKSECFGPECLLGRIHLGSPHLFFRYISNIRKLASDPIDYQLTDTPPSYYFKDQTATGRDLAPLDSDDNMLIFSPRTSSTSQPLREDDSYNPQTGGVYCGDYQQNWELAYSRGHSGSFEKCLDLYNRQMNSLLASSPSLFTSPSTGSTSQVIGLNTEAKNLNQEIIELSNALRSLQNLQSTLPNNLSTINLDIESLKRKQQIIRDQLKDAKDRYHEAEQELYRLQFIPFSRN